MVRIAMLMSLLAVSVLLPVRARAQADAWPVRPVRLVVAYGAGNVADHVARLLATELTARWGQRVVVDNVPGAGGTLGTSQVVRAAPDGQTLGMVAVAALAIVPHMMAKPPYQPLADLVPIAGVSASRSFLAVHAGLPARSVAELVALGRERGAAKPLLYYSAGNGTIPHLNVELLRRALGFPAQHVPYKTSSAGLVETVAGRVDFTMDATSVTLPHIRSGALRGLAYNAPRRHPELAAVPTFAEAVPGVSLPNAWQALFAPRGIAPAVAARVARDTAEVVALPAFIERLPPGAEAFVAGPGELAEQLRADHGRFGRLVAEIGLRAD